MVINNLSSLLRLRNQVFSVAYERICSKLEENEFAVENVQQSFDNAKDMIDELRFLKNMRLKHPLTSQISKLKEERYQSLLSLRGRVNSFLKSPISSERESAKKLDTWFYGFRDELVYATIDGQTGLVNTMLKDVSESSVLDACISSLSLQDTMDSLESMTSTIVKNIKTRSDEKKELLRKAEILKEVAYKKMRTLWKSIEVAIDLGVEDVAMYKESLASISWIMAEYKASVQSKTTRRKNAALKAEEEEKENADLENGEQTTSTNGEGKSSSMFRHVPEYGVETYNEMPVQQTAMQNKTMNGSVVHTIPVNSDQGHDTAVKPEIVNAMQRFITNDSDRESKNE